MEVLSAMKLRYKPKDEADAVNKKYVDTLIKIVQSQQEEINMLKEELAKVKTFVHYE